MRLFCLFLMLWTGWAGAADFYIREVQIEKSDKQYLLSMQVEYQMSQTALEALSNGVPLLLEVRVLVEKVWGSFWEQSPVELRLRYQIRYLALTGLYRVVDMQSGDEESFVTRDAALHALGELTRFELVSTDDLTPGEDYHVRLRAELDIESLPLPLRPLAYLGKGWKLTSEWSQWPLKP
ncbi:MAG: DUF4390 domain-containing protein [Pseudomonadota bacterium]